MTTPDTELKMILCAESMAGSHVLPVSHDRTHSGKIITVNIHNSELP